MVRSKELRVGVCEYGSLYLQENLSDTYVTMYLEYVVIQRIPVRQEVLNQDQRIGVEHICPQIFYLRSNFAEGHFDIFVLYEVGVRVRIILREIAAELANNVPWQ